MAAQAAVRMTVQQRRLSAPLRSVIGAEKRPVPPQLRLQLLGGFRAERVGLGWPVSGWQRRSAKTLTKLLATCRGHKLHREQLLEILWPGVELDSALNSFAKALYAARRALEPDLLPRESSAYLVVTDSMVALRAEHVWIDADQFEQLAESALLQEDVGAFEAALATYGGELLPEDRYADWCAQRRDYLADLHLRLLIGLADALAKRGSHDAAAARLREVLELDPTSEDVHRRLMRLYLAAGARDQAVRQFHLCQEVLRRELELVPAPETQTLYDDIVADGTPNGNSVREAFVGRESMLEHLCEQLTHADAGNGRMVLVSGEAGVGKSRLVAEFADEARSRGACVLRAGSGAHTNRLPYGPFAVALESHVASCSEAERDALAERYPTLVPFVPSLGIGNQHAGDGRLYLVPAITRLLNDLARAQSVVLVLGDLDGLHRSSLNLLEYLAPLAAERRWLIVGTYRDEGLARGSELRRMVAAAEWEGLCLRLELDRLRRPDCDRLVRALRPGESVDEAVLEEVYARSLGNPLFAEELVREMPERNLSVPVCVPASVRALVALRMASVKESVRRVVALVAAAGGTEISLAELRAGAAALKPPVADAALFDALDRALEIRVLQERDGSYSFRHPLVRSALYEDLSKHRRDELHAALAGRPQEPT
jgi:DNA-binding SARP family transcriptional activator